MPRKAKELSALEVRRLSKPGRWSVGGVGGLALQVTASGAKSWVLRMPVGGRQREMGLGSFPSVSLADARDSARAQREKLRLGTDPIEERHTVARAVAAGRELTQTFERVAALYIEQHEPSWKNPKHAGQWRSTLATYAKPVIGHLVVGDIATPHVLKVLEPIWTKKTETASRLRSRIELVLDFATARGLREGPNPARWRGNLDAALPKPSKVSTVAHHAAVPVGEVRDFMARLRGQAGTGARALEFAVLTAARSGEVRGATWREFDLVAKLWTIPGSRMKSGREHRVPLTDAALDVLNSLSTPGEPDALVFPGMRGALSDMSLSAVLRRMGVDATVHGFRSTFRDWISEYTNHPNEVAEMALAHAVGDKVEAAYRRGDLFAKRVALMDEWAAFLAPKEDREAR